MKQNLFKTLPFKLQRARSGFSVAEHLSKIYFCGGNSGGGNPADSIVRRFDCLDLKKGQWQRLPDMLMKRDEL